MATSKTLTADRRASRFKLYLPVGTAHVAVNPRAAYPVVIVSTEDDSGPAADMVNKTTGIAFGDTYEVHIPEPPLSSTFSPGGNVTFNTVGGGYVAQAVHMRTVMVGGQVFSQSATGINAATPPSQIAVTAILPPDTTLDFDSTSASLNVVGDLPALQARTMSGDITVETVGDLQVNATSSNVHADTVLGPTSINAISGQVTVDQYRGSNARIDTTSGQVRLTAAGERRSGSITVNAVSGAITIANSRALGLTVNASIITGPKHID